MDSTSWTWFFVVFAATTTPRPLAPRLCRLRRYRPPSLPQSQPVLHLCHPQRMSQLRCHRQCQLLTNQRAFHLLRRVPHRIPQLLPHPLRPHRIRLFQVRHPRQTNLQRLQARLLRRAHQRARQPRPLPPHQRPPSRRTPRPRRQARPPQLLRHIRHLRPPLLLHLQVLRHIRHIRPLHLLLPQVLRRLLRNQLPGLQLTSLPARPVRLQVHHLPPTSPLSLLPSRQRMSASTSTSVTAVPFRAETHSMPSLLLTVPPPSRQSASRTSWMTLPMVWKNTGPPTPRVNSVRFSSLHLLTKKTESRLTIELEPSTPPLCEFSERTNWKVPPSVRLLWNTVFECGVMSTDSPCSERSPWMPNDDSGRS